MQPSPAAYNVFSRKRKPALRCAVRQDKPMPAFLSEEIWSFSSLAMPTEPPSGFQPQAASDAMWLTGYYLFQVLKE